MDINSDENQDSTQNGEINPVNLVTRIKHEAEEPSTNLKNFTEISDFVNCFRRRRRGRSRYVPYNLSSDQTRIPFNPTNNGVDNSKKIDCFYPSSSNNCKHFSCPNCKLQFANRDSLAMHMMESVRLDGCQTHKPSKNKPSPTLSMLEPTNVNRTQFTSDFENNCRDKIAASSANGTNTYSDLNRDRIQAPCFICKICGETFINLDSLAMHMFIHVQQETTSKEIPCHQKPNQPPILSTNSVLPLPESIWSNHLNSSLYFKSLLTTSLIDPNKFQQEFSRVSEVSNSNKLQTISKLNSVISNSTEDEILERKCRSAPLYNTNIDEKSVSSLNNEIEDKQKSQNDIMASGAASPNLLKDCVDNDIQFLSKLHKCNHCKILFEDATTYCLHMGLHNVNNPWQCNMCGKKCSDLHDFTVHSLHF